MGTVTSIEYRGRRATLGNYMDITEGRQAVERLRDSEARIRAVVDNVAEGIITIDGRGGVESFNPAAQRLFGYAAGEVIGQNVKMLMPEPYAGKHDDYIRAHVQTGSSRILGVGRELMGRRKDGSTFPMELSIGEIRQADHRLFVGIIRDISERKAVEGMKDAFVSEEGGGHDSRASSGG